MASGFTAAHSRIAAAVVGSVFALAVGWFRPGDIRFASKTSVRTLARFGLFSTGTLVGANALVTEGKTFPDGSLILGAPARVVRELTEDEVAAVRESARHYVANAARFNTSLRET